MEERHSVPGDKLILIKNKKHYMLVPQKGDKIEVHVTNGTVTEIEYLIREWRWFIIPQTIKIIDFAVFFYRNQNDQPEVWLAANRRFVHLKDLPLETKFSVTKHRRSFESVNRIFFGKLWRLVEEASELEKYEL